MRVRITRQPEGRIDDVSLRNYRPGEVYDLPSNLAEYLVMEDFAIFEMRGSEQTSLPAADERRRRRH
jgi:hypothetical protein